MKAMERDLHMRLVDHMVLLWAACGVFLYAASQYRAAHVGWTQQDIFHTAAIAAVIGVAVFRGRLSAPAKGLFLAGLAIAIGVVGLYTLGTSAAGGMFLPIGGVYAALVFKPRAVVIAGGAMLAVVVLVALAHMKGSLEPTTTYEELGQSGKHWLVHLASVAFCFVVGTLAIFRFRSLVGSLTHDLETGRDELREANTRLEAALADVKRLSGFLPICSSCRKIRSTDGHWQSLEDYVGAHSEAEFSHDICPSCSKALYPEETEG